MIRASLHPGTNIFIVFLFVLSVFKFSLTYQAVILIFGALLLLKTKPLLHQDPLFIFLRLLLIAAFFLLLIHCISWNGKLVFREEGLILAGKSFFRICSLMISFLWLVRTIKTEEFYAMLIDLHLPIKVIYVLFQVIYLIPKLVDRSKEILLAQQLRGFAMKGILNRLKAYVLILSPLLSATIYEMEENAIALSARGLQSKESKTHLAQICFTRADLVIITFSAAIIFIIIIF